MVTIKPELKDMYRLNCTGDSWGDCMGAFFDLCEYMHSENLDIPYDWGYDPGHTIQPEKSFWTDYFKDCTELELIIFGEALNRLSKILEAQDKNY